MTLYTEYKNLYLECSTRKNTLSKMFYCHPEEVQYGHMTSQKDYDSY